VIHPLPRAATTLVKPGDRDLHVIMAGNPSTPMDKRSTLWQNDEQLINNCVTNRLMLSCIAEALANASD
jgi:hypothetical protein